MRTSPTASAITAFITAGILATGCGGGGHRADPRPTSPTATVTRPASHGEAAPPSVTYHGQVTTTTTRSAPPPTPSQAPTPTTTRPPVPIPGHLLFATDSAVPGDHADDELTAALAQLGPIDVDDDELHVDGYVDDRGSPAVNLALAQARADVIGHRIGELVPVLRGHIRMVGHDDLRDPTCHGDCPQNRAVVISVRHRTGTALG